MLNNSLFANTTNPINNSTNGTQSRCLEELECALYFSGTIAAALIVFCVPFILALRADYCDDDNDDYNSPEYSV